MISTALNRFRYVLYDQQSHAVFTMAHVNVWNLFCVLSIFWN